MKEMVGGCCVCSDERGWPENPLVYCDGQNCTVAVHQACYGIVTVPTGPWYCRKCESQERSARVRCELCPSRDGALKKTDNQGWAHVVCALYIPEVRFGNVTTMEPIILQLIPPERYSKTCYICQEIGKGSRANVGACMQCNKSGCKQQFHVTCAQGLGLLCEEAGNYLDNVKYCGYCQHHYSKLKKGGNVKTIPPYKPITHETGSSDATSSPEKELEPATNTSAPTASSSSASSSAANLKISSNPAANSSSIVASSTSTSSSSSKQRKSSSTSKSGSSASSASSSSAAPNVSGGAAGPGGGASTNPTSSISSNSSSSKNSSSSSNSSKDKDKHGKSLSKVSSSSKSSSSGQDKEASSSSTSSSTRDKSKSSKSTSKDSSGGGGGGGEHSGTTNSTSTLAYSKQNQMTRNLSGNNTSVLASSSSSSSTASSSATSSISGSTKDTLGQKFTTSNFTETVVVNSDSVFGTNDAPNPQQNPGQTSSSAPASKSSSSSSSIAKKRKADSAKQSSSSSSTSSSGLSANSASNSGNLDPIEFNKDIIKDVSVTLIPLPIDKTDSGETDKSAKKPKTETPTPPLQITNEPNLQNVSPNPMLNQSTVTVSSKQQAVQQQQQQATTLSSGITSHIRAPILKDIADTRLRSNSPYNSSTSSSMVGSGTSTPSLYVSVPLSTATVPGVNLPSTTNVSDQISQSQLSRSSPVVNHHHAHSHHHQGNLMSNSQQQPVIERQSPRVHLSSSVALNSSNTSASSSSGGHNIEQSLSSGSSQLSSGAVIQSSNSPAPNHSMTNYAGTGGSVSAMESGSLKITYEKQNPRVSQLQEEQHHGPVRRSRTPDSGNFSNTNSSSIASSNAMMGISSSSTGSGSIGNLNSSGSSGSGSVGGLGRGASAGGGSGGGDSGGLKFCYESQTSSAIQPISPPAAVASSQPPVVKESPPSSPGSEAGSARKRGRKSVESKDIKLFHNGVHATHMLGNQLNPASSVAQKMSDQLHMEIEAHSVYAQPNIDTGPPLVGIPFPGKQSSTRSSSQSSGSNSLTSMLGGSNTTSGSGNTPQSLEQLLERQWEQGSQFLMEQAQHFDIASLLSCLHQLRTENVRLEEHVNNLVARRDHLLAVNARLAIPLNPNVQQQSQAPLNTLHMNGPTTETSAAASLASSRISRTNTHFSGQQQVPVENGIDYRHSSHSTSGSSQATISHN